MNLKLYACSFRLTPETVQDEVYIKHLLRKGTAIPAKTLQVLAKRRRDGGVAYLEVWGG